MMQKMFFSYTRRMIALAGIGVFTVNCLMADLQPMPTRRRPQPIHMNANPSSQQPVRPYIQHMEPTQPKDPMPMIATMYGKLIYLAACATKDANYALYRKVDEKIVPVCFIKWDGNGWEQYENQDVRVTGYVREMKGWTCPLLVVEYPENIEFALQAEEQPLPPVPVFTPVEQTIVEPLPPPQPEPVKPLQPLPPPQTAKPLPPPQPEPVKPLQPLPPPQTANPLPPPQPEPVKPLQPLPPPQTVNPLPPQTANPLPPPQTANPLPPPPPEEPLPSAMRKKTWISPSSDYKPKVPKAVNSIRIYP